MGRDNEPGGCWLRWWLLAGAGCVGLAWVPCRPAGVRALSWLRARLRAWRWLRQRPPPPGVRGAPPAAPAAPPPNRPPIRRAARVPALPPPLLLRSCWTGWRARWGRRACPPSWPGTRATSEAAGGGERGGRAARRRPDSVEHSADGLAEAPEAWPPSQPPQVRVRHVGRAPSSWPPQQARQGASTAAGASQHSAARTRSPPSRRPAALPPCRPASPSYPPLACPARRCLHLLQLSLKPSKTTQFARRRHLFRCPLPPPALPPPPLGPSLPSPSPLPPSHSQSSPLPPPPLASSPAHLTPSSGPPGLHSAPGSSHRSQPDRILYRQPWAPLYPPQRPSPIAHTHPAIHPATPSQRRDCAVTCLPAAPAAARPFICIAPRFVIFPPFMPT